MKPKPLPLGEAAARQPAGCRAAGEGRAERERDRAKRKEKSMHILRPSPCPLPEGEGDFPRLKNSSHLVLRPIESHLRRGECPDIRQFSDSLVRRPVGMGAPDLNPDENRAAAP